MEFDIKTVTIVGGNGTIGKKVAGIFASFGDAKVYVVARTFKKAEEAIEEAALSVKAFSIKDKLIPKSYEDLKKCVEDSDLVFESIVEDFEEKSLVHKEINKYAGETCILATGTSGLSINDLSENYDLNKRSNFVGIHFFNHPYSMTLCELIPSKYVQNMEFINQLKNYLSEKLLRDVIIVKDQPAFLANRIGFSFLNEALQYAEKYKSNGGIDYIDSIFGCYTGRNMAPLKTVDLVGLDVHKSIVNNVYENTNGHEKNSFLLPEFINNLNNDNKLGVKTREGLYKYTEKEELVYDIEKNEYRNKKIYSFPFKEKAIREFKVANYKKGFEQIKNDDSIESRICMELLLKYIINSISISKESSQSMSDCDIAMATGFNWIPPVALIHLFADNNEIVELCQKYIDKSIDFKSLFDDIEECKIDYKKYVKARE